MKKLEVMQFLSSCLLRPTGLSSPADNKSSRDNKLASSLDLTGSLSVWPTNVSYQSYRWKKYEFIDCISGFHLSLIGE